MLRMHSRLDKSIKRIGTYVLKGFKLEFNCGKRYEAFANVVKTGSPKDFVEGVLYELTPEQVYVLDHYEGVPYHYVKFYFQDNGRIIYGYLSESEDFKSSALPTLFYLRTIQKGAEENDLYHTYNLMSEIIKKVKRYDNLF